MRNVPFVIWMVGMPLVNSYSEYVSEYLLRNQYSDGVQAGAALVSLVIWASVGALLYEKA